MPGLDELAALVDGDPRVAADGAARLAAEFRDSGDAGSRSRALSIVGRAQRLLGEIDAAESSLRAATVAGEEAGDDELVADAQLALAAVLSFAGRASEAFEHLVVVDQRGSERLRAHAALQRAALAQRLGNVDDALTYYEAALPVLQAEGAAIDVARVLANRAVIWVGMGQVTPAVADFVAAAEAFRDAGQEFAAAQVLHNLGWGAARLGDLPRALQAFDDAQAEFARLGHPAVEAQVERAEALLAAGLFLDAGTLAAETGDLLAAAGNHSVAAESWLLCAQAARVADDPDMAGAYATRARTAFAAQGATGGLFAARLEELRADHVGDAAEQSAALRALADDLASAGNAIGRVTALALAAGSDASAGRVAAAGEAAAECARLASTIGVVEARLAAASAAAAAARAAGDGRRAQRAVKAGLDDLARHQGSLGATDARAHVAVHGRELAATGLRLALDDRSAASALEWMERVRAGALRHPPARPPDDAALAAELAELRGVAADARRAALDGVDAADLRALQAEREAAIRRRLLRVAGAAQARPAPAVRVRALHAALDGCVLAALAAVDGRLHAVVVGEARSRLVDLGPVERVLAAAATATTALRVLVTADHPGVGAHNLLVAALDALDQRALQPLRLGDGPVVLVVPGPLHVAPWRAAPSLAGRAVTIAPSAAVWLSTVEPVRAGAMVAVAGPRLSEATAEAAAVAACYAHATVLAGSDATAEAVTGALAASDVAHIAAHGHYRPDNPLWSSIEVSDGPISVYDLERVPHTPGLVVLSVCESGVSGVRAGDELLGLSSALLRLGTRSLVAAIGPLPDTPATRRALVAFHEMAARGVAPGEALARAAPAGPDDDLAVAASLACFGHG